MLLVGSYKLCSIFTPPPENYALFIVCLQTFYAACIICIFLTLLFSYNRT